MSLKLVRLDLLMGGNAHGRFLRDAAGARDIRHPNIAAVYDVGETDGQAYFTMEALEGVSLRDWNRRRLTTGGDLGMSSHFGRHLRDPRRDHDDPHPEPGPDRSQARQHRAIYPIPRSPMCGSSSPMSGVPISPRAMTSRRHRLWRKAPTALPKQLTAAGSDLRPSADLYSVSMIFYELLTGVPLAGHWQAPSTGRKDVPPAIDALIQNGLSNNPRRRPQSVEEYRRILNRLSEPGCAMPPSLATEPPDPKPEPLPDPQPAPSPRPT